MGSILGKGTKSPQAIWYKQKIKLDLKNSESGTLFVFGGNQIVYVCLWAWDRAFQLMPNKLPWTEIGRTI